MIDLLAIGGAMATIAIGVLVLAALTAQSPGAMVPLLIVVTAAARWLWRRS